MANKVEYYLITNIGTWDCSVQIFTDLDEAIDYYRDFTASNIDCILAQKIEVGGGPGEVTFAVSDMRHSGEEG